MLYTIWFWSSFVVGAALFAACAWVTVIGWISKRPCDRSLRTLLIIPGIASAGLMALIWFKGPQIWEKWWIW
jgi:hypothetical protein